MKPDEIVEALREYGETHEHGKILDACVVPKSILNEVATLIERQQKVCEAALETYAKIKKVTGSGEYISIFALADNHGCEYSGESFGMELDYLGEALRELDGGGQ